MIEKIKLYKACIAEIDKRINIAQESLDAAIKAGNEETKSSVGDKYETGRAMMQMEQDKYRGILIKTINLKNKLQQIDLNKKYEKAEEGAIVIANNGVYFFATSIGKIILDEKKYYVLSTDAPLAKAFYGKKKNETINFLNKKYTISDIF